MRAVPRGLELRIALRFAVLALHLRLRHLQLGMKRAPHDDQIDDREREPDDCGVARDATRSEACDRRGGNRRADDVPEVGGMSVERTPCEPRNGESRDERAPDVPKPRTA